MVNKFLIVNYHPLKIKIDNKMQAITPLNPHLVMAEFLYSCNYSLQKAVKRRRVILLLRFLLKPHIKRRKKSFENKLRL